MNDATTPGAKPRPACRTPEHTKQSRRARYPAALALIAILLCACQVIGKAAIAGTVTSISLPPDSRLTVQLCGHAVPDCDRWIYPDVAGRFAAVDLEPGLYTAAVFLEERNGLVPLASREVTVLPGVTTPVDIAIEELPSIPST